MIYKNEKSFVCDQYAWRSRSRKALIELLKHFPKEQYEVSLYVLLDQEN